MSAEASASDVVIPAKAGIHLDVPSSRHSRESGNPLSFARYPKYKDSDVAWLGEVPEPWEIKPIKAVASCNDDVLAESTDSTDEIVYVEISGVSPDKGITDAQTLAFGAAPSRARRRVQDGDVLVSTVRTYLRAIAPLSDPPENMIASTGFAVIRPRAISSAFLGYMFRSEFLVAAIIARSVGVSYPAINASDLMRLSIPVPRIDEQSAIAAFLDRETAKVDKLIAEQEKLIALLKEKRQALISHAVTTGLDPNVPMKDSGIEWLGKVPTHWELKRLKHVKAKTPNAFVDGPFGSNLKSEHFVDDGDVYVIESSFATQRKLDEAELKMITSEHFATIQRSQVKGGDIVIAKIGAQFGKSAVLPDLELPAVVSGNSMKLTVDPNECTTDWVLLQLENLKTSSPEIELMANGSAQPALSLGSMNELPILVPPLAEQRDIVEVVTNDCTRLSELDASAFDVIMLLKERRAALISAAVTGKIDVRNAS